MSGNHRAAPGNSRPETVTEHHVVHRVERVVKVLGETRVVRTVCGVDVVGLTGRVCPACREARTGGPERR